MNIMKKRWIAGILIICILWISALSATMVWAEGPGVIIIFSSNTVAEGDTVTVRLRFSCEEAIASVDGHLIYDSSVIEYVATSDGLDGGGGNLHFKENAETPGEQLEVSLTFRALKAGSTTLSVEGKLFNSENISLGEASASTTLTVTNSTYALSSNNNLAELTPSQGTLTPDFDPDITEYTVEVDYSVTQLLINARPQDEKATWILGGTPTLVVGSNQRSITVTAEDGKKKTYTITIFRAAPPETPKPSKDPSGETQRPTDSRAPQTSEPYHTQIPYTSDPAPTATDEMGTVPVGTPTQTPTQASTPTGTPGQGMTVDDLKSSIVTMLVIGSIVVIVVLFTVVYCLQQKEQKRKSGGQRSTNHKRRR